MADIDFFKHVNDKYGHPAGDRILADTALAIQSACRDYDIVGRYGGEEFAVILPNTTAEKAAVIAERMRKKVAENIHSWEGNDIQISVSLGTASSEDTPEIELKSLVKKADDALLEAKKKGRDQVVVWTGNAA
jgi:two-component system chemotaxis response regulator CheY